MTPRTDLLRHLLIALAVISLLVTGLACEGDDDDDSAATDDDDDTSVVDQWVVGTVIDTEGTGVLATTPGPWGDDLLVIRVQGSQYEMGYQYGRLLGPYLLDLWWTYIGEIGEELGATDPEQADEVVGALLDQIWGHFEPHTPTEHLDLLQGIADGMHAGGHEYGSGDVNTTTFIRRLVGFAELAVSSHLDGDDIIGLANLVSQGYSDELLDYYGRQADASSSQTADELAAALEAIIDPSDVPGEPGLFNCSSYAAWGDRTEGGALYGTRNMDFSAGTGIYRYGNVAAFVPDEGIPFVTVSWAGMTLGGLAGINREGVSIGNAQSSTPMERLATESALLRGSRVLQHATDVESALEVLEQAPTVGVAGVLGWGDPAGGGAAAEAAAFEMNGVSLAVMRNRHDCSVDTTLYRYTYEGDVDTVLTDADSPELANLEQDAVEIDGEAGVRYFACNDPCASAEDLIVDAHGRYTEVAGPEDGMPVQTGFTSDCAVFRGDSALNYGVRIHQSASQGPFSGDGTGLMNYSGAYRERYKPFWEMTEAYAAGEAYEAWDATVIEDNGGTPMPIGLDEVEMMSRVTGARTSNVWDLAFDATNLVIRVSYESGTGDDWVGAHEQPSFLEIELEDLFLLDD